MRDLHGERYAILFLDGFHLKVRLAFHVVDDDENPARHKKVFCNFPGILPTHSREYTDEDGGSRV